MCRGEIEVSVDFTVQPTQPVGPTAPETTFLILLGMVLAGIGLAAGRRRKKPDHSTKLPRLKYPQGAALRGGLPSIARSSSKAGGVLPPRRAFPAFR